MYVCTGCGWFGGARTLGPKACTKGSVPSNNHASRSPDCPFSPCLVLERTPGQSRKQDAAAYLARCTPEQRALGMPPTGGCAPCVPTPKGYPEGYQWVEVQLPEGRGPGETFEHLNHNGRFMMTVTVPNDVCANTTTLVVETGNKRRRSARERQRSAERRAATVECATAERDAAEIATDAQAAAERDAAERAAAKRAADAEAKRLAAAITAQSDAHPTACGSVQVRGGGPTGEVVGAVGGVEGGVEGGATSASAHGGGEAAQGGGHADFVIYGDLQPLNTDL